MAQSGGAVAKSRWDKGVDIAQIASPLIAVAAVVVTMVLTGQANETAAKSLGVAQDAQALNESAIERALALKVYIGGSPPEVLRENPGVSTVGVINTSSVDMYEVSVYGLAPSPVERPDDIQEDGEPSDIPRFESIPNSTEEWIELTPFRACTGYTVPEGFRVEGLRFFDGANYWVRYWDGRLEKTGTKQTASFPYAEVDPSIFNDDPYEPVPAPVAFDAPSCS